MTAPVIVHASARVDLARPVTRRSGRAILARAVPTPAAPFLGFLLGSLFAWVAADELSRSATLQARTLIVVASFGLLVYAPIAGYFLAFAPDWSYGYLVDSQRLPGAIDTAWVLVDAASVPLGFARAARHVRTKRTGPMMRLMAVPALAAGGLVLAALPRLGVHATYSQFHGDFGTRPVAGSPLGYALLAMTLVLLAGVGITVAWLRRSSRAAQRD